MSEIDGKIEAIAEALRLLREGQGYEKKLREYEGKKDNSYDGALGFLCKAFEKDIIRFCADIVGPELVEDVAQDTLFIARQAMPKFRGERDEQSLQKWLFVIALNECRRALRRQKRETRQEAVIEKMVADTPVHPLSYEQRIRWRNVWENMSQEQFLLAPGTIKEEKEKFILSLLRNTDMTIKEIAEAVRLKESTVRQHISRNSRYILAVLGLEI